jgi:hypothetical protein
MTATVTNLDDSCLIREGEAAVDQYNKAQATARKQIMPMALGLLAARRQYPADRVFGDWLQTSSYRELEKDDRAALIKIGEHEAFAAKYIPTTNRTSPRTIWDAIAELLPVSHYAKPIAGRSTTEITIVSTAPSAENVQSPESKQQANLPEPVAAITGRHPFLGRSRAMEVHAVFKNPNTRTLIGKLLNKRGIGNEIWSLILQSIDAGFLTPTGYEPQHATARLLFPNAPPKWANNILLTDTRDLTTVRDQIMPAALANRGAILKAPDQMDRILREHAQRMLSERNANQHRERTEAAKAAMPASESEVIMFGRQFWPSFNAVVPYDYDQLAAAVFFFEDANRLARLNSDGSPKSCGIRVRQLVKWLSQYVDRQAHDSPARNNIKGVLSLVVELTRALACNADGSCIRPKKPDVDRYRIEPGAQP